MNSKIEMSPQELCQTKLCRYFGITPYVGSIPIISEHFFSFNGSLKRADLSGSPLLKKQIENVLMPSGKAADQLNTR